MSLDQILSVLIASGSVALFVSTLLVRLLRPAWLHHPDLALGGAMGQFVYALLLIAVTFHFVHNGDNIQPLAYISALGFLICVVFWIMTLIRTAQLRQWIWMAMIFLSLSAVFLVLPGVWIALFGLWGPTERADWGGRTEQLGSKR